MQQQEILVPTVELKHGVLPGTSSPVKMPLFGCGLSHNGGWNDSCVGEAMNKLSIRLFDTAKRYGNEHLLSKHIQEFNRQLQQKEQQQQQQQEKQKEEENEEKRESMKKDHDKSLFISTKLWPFEIGRSSSSNSSFEQDVRNAVDCSLKQLGVSQIDLYLLHWPSVTSSGQISSSIHGVSNPAEIRRRIWSAMETEILVTRKARAIGVSNFEVRHLADIIEQNPNKNAVLPAVVQNELHPFCPNVKVREYCQKHGIVFGGYCPLAKAAALDNPVVKQLAEAVGIPASGLLLRWSMEHCGAVTIPMSTNLDRQRQNVLMTLLPIEDAKKLHSASSSSSSSKSSSMSLNQAFTELDGLCARCGEYRATWDPTSVL